MDSVGYWWCSSRNYLYINRDHLAMFKTENTNEQFRYRFFLYRYDIQYFIKFKCFRRCEEYCSFEIDQVMFLRTPSKCDFHSCRLFRMKLDVGGSSTSLISAQKAAQWNQMESSLFGATEK